MPDDDDRYFFAQTEPLGEVQRLHYLEAAMDPTTIACLESIGVDRLMALLRGGAGAGSITRWLAQRVDSEGQAVALDYNPRFLTGLPSNVTVRNVDVVEPDAFEEPMDIKYTLKAHGPADPMFQYYRALLHHPAWSPYNVGTDSTTTTSPSCAACTNTLKLA